ncbi:acyl carrier protein phosphodiesterase [Salinimonas chungwhensis]|uniref:acyl carrier protein phosphodiesterase n=1 Tax=Salinimonas chungwhensis TaxID=265425 RepID=UPI00036EE33E|nr:ACP phosphodiesterase [Salinimonas chungwhensis]
MNYLAHMYLARPVPASRFGNLLGDFMRGSQPGMYPLPVRKGLANHRWVDRFTDTHGQVSAAKQLISPKRKRFAGIITDISFDHFLIKHWKNYSQVPLDIFCENVYDDLTGCLAEMPSPMQKTVTSMVQHKWLAVYKDMDGLARALDNTARRIRFPNQFSGSIKEVEKNYLQLEQAFLNFFPTLIDAVNDAAIEQSGHENLADSQLDQK